MNDSGLTYIEQVKSILEESDVAAGNLVERMMSLEGSDDSAARVGLALALENLRKLRESMDLLRSLIPDTSRKERNILRRFWRWIKSKVGERL